MGHGGNSSKNYDQLFKQFRVYHTHPLNLALHLITSPLGVVAVLSILQPIIGLSFLVPLAVVYQVLLLRSLSFVVWSLNGVVLTLIFFFTSQLNLSFLGSLATLIFSYLMQDFAHWITGEPTFQSTYQKSSNFWKLYEEHVYYLLPLVIESCVKGGFIPGVLSWFVNSSSTMLAKIEKPDESRALDQIRQWILDQKPSKDHTTHWWYHSLKGNIKTAFDAIASSPTIMHAFRANFSEAIYDIEILPGMNEIYVAALDFNGNSDQVFFTDHVDGPWMLFPFCSVYRCIAAVNPNEQIETVFPSLRGRLVIERGEVVGFDFNREIHRIQKVPGKTNKESRMSLKLHYCIYPKCLRWYGKLLGYLTTQYDIIARKAFLKTLVPTTFVEKTLAKLILITTDVFHGIHRYLGPRNILYLITVLLLGLFVDSRIWLIATSFFHYFIYIGTYYHRGDVTYNDFQRDCIIFKGLALANLAYFYFKDFEFHLLSLILCALGFGLSMVATKALGTDRTYFGVELGLYEPKWVASFPYGIIPHPMIMGGIIGLIGIQLSPAVHTQVPYLVPVHIGLYVLHMLQEQWNVHLTKLPRSVCIPRDVVGRTRP